MAKFKIIPDGICEDCQKEVFGVDHLEWTNRFLCPSCYDEYVFENSIELQENE